MVNVLEWGPTSTRADLLDYVAGLPDQADRNYELALTKTAELSPPMVFTVCREVLDDSSEGLHPRFAALYIVAIHLRRFKSYTEFAQLLDKHGSEFTDQPLFAHLAGLLYAGRGGVGDLRQAIDLSRRAAKELPVHSGALHAFAFNVACALEEGMDLESELLPEAQRALSVAVGFEPNYAKFYCTRGRLMSLRGDYAGARASIERAMDLEDEHKSDYAIRLGEYQHHLARVFMAELRGTLAGEFEAARAQIDAAKALVETELSEMRSQNLTTLGLFTAILSFTLGSIQIVQNQPFDLAARLIIIMAGCILVVYGLFSIMITAKGRGWRPMLVQSIAGAVTVLAALLWK